MTHDDAGFPVHLPVFLNVGWPKVFPSDRTECPAAEAQQSPEATLLRMCSESLDRDACGLAARSNSFSECRV